MSPFATITRFFGEVQDELKKVKWPTQKETVRLTVIVIVVSVVLGAYIGGLDAILAKTIETIIKR